jgi:very-short-patch-repair endonuclease
MNYDSMSDSQKFNFLKTEYEEKKRSFGDIAKDSGTYSNKLLRDAKKYKINIRSRSEAQQNALKTGKSKHPTAGTERSSDIKEKIGLKVLQAWENLSEDELEERKTKSRERWENLDEDLKENILKKANTAVRLSSKTGSKLEKYLLENLISAGHRVEFHKEQSLLTTKLQIDLFLPQLNVAIEVDGPSHFEAVWGEDNLKKNKKYDNKKEGLLLGKGLTLIRVKQTKDFSKSRAKLVFDKLKDVLDNLKNYSKTITIGDE